MYFFMGGTADDVVWQYISIIGRPALPPFWALGFHQCSWQYNSTQDLVDVVNNYTSKGYHFDTIWTDIPYMENLIDFTLDDAPGRPYETLGKQVDDWHEAGIWFVPILDAGVGIKNDWKGKNYF